MRNPHPLLKTLLCVTLWWLAGESRAAWAQQAEPTYTMTLPGKQTAFVGLRVGQTPEGTTVQITPRETGGLSATHQLDMTVVVDQEGMPISCLSKFVARATPHQPLLQEVTRGPKDGEGRITYLQHAPLTRGTLTFARPIVTSMGLILFPGRLYDWQKGGEQQFLFLQDIGATVPVLHSLYLKGESGTEEIELESGKVKARRLTYRANLPFLAKEQQTGKLYVGPNGELLWSPNAVFGIPFKLKEPGKVDTDRHTLELTLAGDVKVTVRAEQKREGIETQILLNNSISLTTAMLDANLRLIRLESLFPGRKMTAQVQGNNLNWELEATAPAPLTLSAPYPMFFPQWFATELWEGGKGPYAGMQVGESRLGCHPPVYFAVPIANPFAVERVEDMTTTVNGESVTVHRYRFAFSANPGKAKIDNIYEVYTDGRRLIALLSVGGGVQIKRDGWDSFIGTLKPPTIPTPETK